MARSSNNDIGFGWCLGTLDTIMTFSISPIIPSRANLDSLVSSGSFCPPEVSHELQNQGVIERFDRSIMNDVTDSMSHYVSHMIPDHVLASLVGSCEQLDLATFSSLVVVSGTFAPVRLPTSPTKNPRNASTASYRAFRLREYKFLRDNFPDLNNYYVERSKTYEARVLDQRRFLVQVNSTGYYFKKSTLKRCKFFQRMFVNRTLEYLNGRCHLKTNNFMCVDEALGAILQYLGGRDVDYQEHHWLDILIGSDYLECQDMKLSLDLSLTTNANMDYEEAALCLQKIENFVEWSLPVTANMCIGLIKSNLHVLVHGDEPYDIISRLSRATMISLLSDLTLTYFTMSERKVVLWKWISTGETVEVRSDREALFRFIDCSEDTCPSLELQLQKFAAENEARSSMRTIEACIILAGGTGDGTVFSTLERYARPSTPSTSLMAYNIEGDYWIILPDLPVGMVKPLVACNGLDEIYVVDSHAFREQDLIQQHFLFRLKYQRSGWYWKSIQFAIPSGIRSFELTHLFCVNYKVYFLGAAKMYGQTIREWKMGPEHRNLLESSQDNCVEPEKGVVLLLTLDLKTGICDVDKFLFHVDRDFFNELNACVVESDICVETAGYVLNESTPNHMNQIFSVYNCKDGLLHCKTGKVIPTKYDKLLPNPEQTGVMALTLGGCCFRKLDISDSCWIEVTSTVVQFPPPGSYNDEDKRKSYSVVSHGDKIYYLGECYTKKSGSSSQTTCKVMDLPNSFLIHPRWRKRALLPRPVMHAGATCSCLDSQSLLHHHACPHCAVYPQDMRRADMSEVSLPSDYEATLMSVYPPGGPF